MNFRFLACYCLLLLVLQASCTNVKSTYGTIIITNAGAKKTASDAVYDLQYQLAKTTGIDFKWITKDSTFTTGIQLVLLDPQKDAGFDKRLSLSNPDAFLLRSDGKQSLLIAAYTGRGLIDGIYTYLDKLGFRWFHPGEDWAYAPALTDITLECNEVIVPDFSLRNFFGTYGTPRNAIVDPTKRVDKEWPRWAMRNRMAGGLKGHAWNEFLWRNVEALKAHPEYMALIKEKRVFPNTAMKFCISNEDFQQLFIKDMVAQLKKAMGNDVHGVYSISVEPSDGEGDCECDECKKLGSISNRDFLLANLVAKEFQKISPTAYVNLYAYNDHAAPPDFALEKNVLVQIIPYGYQHFSSPEQMIEAWKKKDDNLFLYDYYGLPITNEDKPLQGALRPEEFVKRIQYWHENHINGVSLESSYSIGSTGLGLYLFARLAWDIHSDATKLLEEYYRLNYGKAAPVVQQVQKMLNDEALTIATVDKAAQLLKSGTGKIKLDTKQQTCLTDYKAYLIYLHLFYNVKDKAPEPAASDSLMRYSHSIFQTMMVHTESVVQHAQRKWTPAEFATVKQLSPPEIETLFNKTFN